MSEKNINFEYALAELEKVISEVENGSMPLEKMIENISRGAELVRFCQKRLNTLNSKVEMLFKDDGKAGVFEEFDPATERARAANGDTPAPHKAAKTEKSTDSNQESLPF